MNNLGATADEKFIDEEKLDNDYNTNDSATDDLASSDLHNSEYNNMMASDDFDKDICTLNLEENELIHTGITKGTPFLCKGGYVYIKQKDHKGGYAY